MWYLTVSLQTENLENIRLNGGIGGEVNEVELKAFQAILFTIGKSNRGSGAGSAFWEFEDELSCKRAAKKLKESSLSNWIEISISESHPFK